MVPLGGVEIAYHLKFYRKIVVVVDCVHVVHDADNQNVEKRMGVYLHRHDANLSDILFYHIYDCKKNPVLFVLYILKSLLGHFVVHH